ncbi:hypothetical protein AAG906_027934 [Vitis piasezkii]
MTTRGVPSPTSIHFTIDGHHGILEARHIAEWSPVSQRDMVRILSMGTSTDLILLWKEPPPRMLLVDVVTISYLGCFVPHIRGLLLWPTPLDHGLLVHFEEKVHRKKLQRADTIPLLFPRLLC